MTFLRAISHNWTVVVPAGLSVPQLVNAVHLYRFPIFSLFSLLRYGIKISREISVQERTERSAAW